MSSTAPHIVLFELYAGGHQLQYLLALADFWATHGCRGRLTIAVPRTFIEARPWIEAYMAERSAAHVDLVQLDGTPQLGKGGLWTILKNDLESGRFLKRTVEQLRPTHLVMMYVDHMQASLALDLRLTHPVALSGIYFQPSFHYGDLGQAPTGWKEALRRFRKVLTLRAALRNPHLTHLFSLDPYVVPHVQRMTDRVEVVHLPDGIPAEPPRNGTAIAQLRATLGVDPDRRLLLLFGSLTRRKGTFETLEAVARLGDEEARTAAVVLVGSVPSGDRDALHERLAHLQATSAAQIILHDDFVPEEAVQGYFDAADLALLPYQRHVGSSGVLIRAATAGRPVLASDYGLLGENVRRHRLGRDTDTTNPTAIARALTDYLRAPTTYPFDTDAARRFAEAHTSERMAETLFSHLGALPATAANRPL